MQRDSALRIEHVSRSFGGVRALNDVTLSIPAGRIVGLIGPNGSGKTTLFNIITGLVRPDAGRVVFRGQDITQLSPEAVNRLGIGRTFQVTRLFGRMTVLENLIVVGRGSPAATLKRANELLELAQLQQVRDEYAERLSYGQQKLLEFARLLMTELAIVMLDEVFAGLNPVMEQRLLERLRQLVELGKTIFITDHEMKIMLTICSQVFVLDSGELISSGTPEHIRADPRVLEAYFGR